MKIENFVYVDAETENGKFTYFLDLVGKSADYEIFTTENKIEDKLKESILKNFPYKNRKKKIFLSSDISGILEDVFFERIPEAFIKENIGIAAMLKEFRKTDDPNLKKTLAFILKKEIFSALKKQFGKVSEDMITDRNEMLGYFFSGNRAPVLFDILYECRHIEVTMEEYALFRNYVLGAYLYNDSYMESVKKRIQKGIFYYERLFKTSPFKEKREYILIKDKEDDFNDMLKEINPKKAIEGILATDFLSPEDTLSLKETALTRALFRDSKTLLSGSFIPETEEFDSGYLKYYEFNSLLKIKEKIPYVISGPKNKTRKEKNPAI